MKITLKQASKLTGRVLRFTYPTDFETTIRCMVPRCIRVDSVEEKDGGIVISGYDFETGQGSTFYCESIEDVEDAGDRFTDQGYSVKLVEFEDVKSSEQVFQSPCLGEVQTWLSEWMNEPLGLGVVVLPPQEAA